MNFNKIMSIKYNNEELLKIRDMSYLSECHVQKKEYIETRDTFEKSIDIVKKYYGIDRLNLIADFCSGHTFNAFFALSRNYTKYVWVHDTLFPKASEKLPSYYLNYTSRVEHRQGNIFLNKYIFPNFSLVTSIHPCRDLSFRVAEIAIENNIPLVIVPCCNGGNRKSWVDEFQDIGAHTRHAMKVAQFIESNNYEIKVKTINKNYTPRNYIIIGIPKNKERVIY